MRARVSFDPPDELSSNEITLGPGLHDTPIDDPMAPDVDPGADDATAEPDPIE
jgi:hypothetical protein